MYHGTCHLLPPSRHQMAPHYSTSLPCQLYSPILCAIFCHSCRSTQVVRCGGCFPYFAEPYGAGKARLESCMSPCVRSSTTLTTHCGGGPTSSALLLRSSSPAGTCCWRT